MQEALLAFISQMLMDEMQLVTIQKLFNTMDESGEGTLDKDELLKGF
jgi:Ca2+-binding EF-hand superfamily protein